MSTDFEPGKPTRIEIGYRGYAIHFSENDERWRCAALDLDAEKMSTLKTKLDKVIAASRKLTEEKVGIYVDHHSKATPVRVVAFAQPGHRYSNKSGNGPPTHAWCMVPGREKYYDQKKGGYAYREKEERQKIDLKKLFADTPETHAILREMQRLDAEIEQLRTKHKAEAEKLKLAQHLIEIDPVDTEQESDRDGD